MDRRIAVHEVGHGIIALSRGFLVRRVRLDGPRDRPGKVDRDVPPEEGKDCNDPVWASKDLAVFCGGFVAEGGQEAGQVRYC